MMGLFYLLTLYLSIRAAVSPAWALAVPSVLACAAGMACKETMATAPLIVVLFDRTFVFDSFTEALRSAAASIWPGATWMVSRRITLVGAALGVGRLLDSDHGVDVSAEPGRDGRPLSRADVLAASFDLGLRRAARDHVGRGGAVRRDRRRVVDCHRGGARAAADVGVPRGVVLRHPRADVERHSDCHGGRAERRLYLPLAAIVVLVVVSGIFVGVISLRRLQPIAAVVAFRAICGPLAVSLCKGTGLSIRYHVMAFSVGESPTRAPSQSGAVR